MLINICGVPYNVVEREDKISIDTHFGLIDYAKCEISINKDIPEAKKKETLCHEIIHGILIHIGRTEMSEDETFVQSLANAIYQTFEIKEGEEE